MAEEDVLENLHRGSRWWLWALGLLLLAGGGVGAYLALAGASPGNPVRVVVAMRGQVDATFDPMLTGAFVERLEGMGFDVEEAPQPLTGEGEALVAQARTLAAELDAAHALVLDPRVEEARRGVTDGSQLYSATLTARLVPKGEDADVRTDAMEFTFEAATAAEVARKVGGAWSDLLAPVAIDWLYESAPLEPILAGQEKMELAQWGSKLREKREAVEARRERVRSFADYCDTERGKLSALSGANEPTNVQCVGDPCGQWTVLSVSEDGETAFVQNMARRPMFELYPTRRSSWVEPPETVLAVPLADGAEVETVFRAGHFYGYGDPSPDGGTVSLHAFGADGVLAVVGLDLARGEWRTLSALGNRERAVRSLPAPGGAGVLVGQRSGDWYYEDEGGRAPIGRQLRHARWVEVPGEGLRAVATDRSGALVLVGTDGSVEPLAELDGRPLDLMGGDDGRIAVQTRTRTGCELVTVELATGRIASTNALPSCLDEPALLPDGRLVALAEVTSAGDAPGDPELVLVDAAAGRIEAMTSGPYREEVVHLSRDGSRVVFNRRLENWPSRHDLGIYRRVVCWADVPPQATARAD